MTPTTETKDNISTTSLSVLYIGGDLVVYNQLTSLDLLNVERVENSLLAIKYIDQKPLLQAIICENNLPGMNGVSVFKILNDKHLTGKNIPFIVVDRKFDENTRKQALEAGIDDLYIKPLNPHMIQQRLLFLIKYKPLFKQYSAPVISRHKDYHIPTIKRAFDLITSGIALLVISPVLLLVALLIKLESKGPVFYISRRVGTGYHVFDFYKFRSMYSGAELHLKSLTAKNQYGAVNEEITPKDLDRQCPLCTELGRNCSPILYVEGKEICENEYFMLKRERAKSTFIKIADDPRVTRIGRILRKTSIDELPQLINVLKGDMSIVGNRPLPIYEAELLTSDEWGERFLGPAGITGLWQVHKRGRKEMSDEERKQLDNQYARDNTFLGDLKIILLTIPALFQKENV